MTNLSQEHAAADGTAPLLSGAEVARLQEEVPTWRIEDGKLTRDVKVRNFKEALALVNRLGEVADAENHHPDMLLHSWNRVRIQLYTHTVNGLSRNDFIMAARFEEILPR